MKARICILKTDGTNCDHETMYAFQKAGGNAEIVSVNDLRSKKTQLTDYQVLVIPGGFSYGDDVASGKILAVELLTYLKDQLENFISQDKLVIGICNGFQVLVRTGLLPFKNVGTMQATLSYNDSGTFECRWVSMQVEKSPCVFTKELEGQEIMLPAAHAEGKYFTDDAVIQKIEDEQLVVLRYTHAGTRTQAYPNNPNGSLHAIAGICDPTGRIFGLMPHPERFVEHYQHPNWRRENYTVPHGLPIFEQAVCYFN